ncbi:hypothetical protein WA588_001743, partial [Blastocystis sp. NMH]
MTPPFIPPSHFAAVQEGLYRGSFPDTINYPFLESLHLKCIVSMLPDGEPEGVKQFCEKNKIKHIHIDTEEYDVDCIPSKEEKNRVISLLLDSDLYPLFFFGSQSSMITSVYVMLLRFVQRYHSSFIFREFKKFDEKIDDDLKSIFDDLRITLPAHLPRWLPVNAINPQ